VTQSAAISDTPVQLPATVNVPAEVHSDDLTTITPKKRRRRFLNALIGKKTLGVVSALIVVGAVVNWGVLGVVTHNIDADPNFAPVSVPPGGSQAVAMAAALLERELIQNQWTPNDPIIAPSAFLDNMPNFQMGVQKAVARFTFELLDNVARRRNSSIADPDLERATGFLQFPPDIWLIDLDRSWFPGIPSEHQYLAGVAALKSFNNRLSNGQAIFEPRSDTLADTLRQVSADLGSQTAQLESVQNTGWWIFNRDADDLFYQGKGLLYAYSMLMKALGEDFAPVIQSGGFETIWAQAMESLEQGSQLRPFVVLDGDLDRSIFANHLAMQGFYMKRAFIQLEEMVSVLEL